MFILILVILSCHLERISGLNCYQAKVTNEQDRDFKVVKCKSHCLMAISVVNKGGEVGVEMVHGCGEPGKNWEKNELALCTEKKPEVS